MTFYHLTSYYLAWDQMVTLVVCSPDFWTEGGDTVKACLKPDVGNGWTSEAYQWQLAVDTG